MQEPTTTTQPTQEEAPKPVFPSDYEVLSSILDQYQKQIADATKQTDDAIAKLRLNLKNAEEASIGQVAQRKLLETLARDMKKLTNRPE